MEVNETENFTHAVVHGIITHHGNLLWVCVTLRKRNYGFIYGVLLLLLTFTGKESPAKKKTGTN